MSELLEPHIGLWGLTKWRQAPLVVWWPRGCLNSACGEHLLAPEAVQKGYVKTKWVIWLVPETREVSGPAWAKQTLQHQSECCQDQGRLHGSSIRDNLDFWWWSDCNGLCQDPRAIPPPAPLAPALLPSGARSCWVQEEHTPRANWISSPGLLRQQCGTWPCPWQGDYSGQTEGKPCLTPGSTRSLYLWVCFCFILHICFIFFFLDGSDI